MAVRVRGAFPDWSRAFIAHSQRAVSVRQYAADLVPGLLQTEEYARAVLSLGMTLNGAEHLGERVAARMGRQQRPTAPGRPELWVVLDEAVLRRPIGGGDVMRAQLERLVEAGAEPHIRVWVLPFEQGGRTTRWAVR
ncbi:DUF5753 domain-containing protein [Streptomyces sp. NPDC006617]|uniref:DUF5753 domain-containing protein n=1 Tax=Streptomyces sp. NPDC006617 TaxID=3155354 RepID=UPI0033AA1242